ncbi:MAG: efflux RND transporter periplasmic adaptor subunit [Opitutae bacterium]|nr:efflux RND transporter periplasmic adaptor subunit [Opitutae bacterium]
MKTPFSSVSWTRIGLMLLAASGGLLSGCNRSGDAAGKAGALPPVPVQIAAVEQTDVPRRIDSVGTVQALRTVAVKSQVDGIVAKIHFREGDEVKAGDLLVTLDQRPFENSLRIARADLANARAEAARAAADAERYQRLDRQEAVSKEQLSTLLTKAETTKALVQAKEAAVANAELQLGYTQIRAPIAGRTGQRLLHEGALVKANDIGQSFVTINQLAPIAVAFSVPEPVLAEVRAAFAAHQVVITVSNRNTGLTRTDGRLEFIDNTVDPTTGTITLKAVFANADAALWPGQFLQVQTQVGVDQGALVVPTSAVMTGQQGTQIYVMKSDHTVELRPVKPLRTAGDRTLLAEGVKAGETVISDGQLRLLPGFKVEPKTLGEAPAAAH